MTAPDTRWMIAVGILQLGVLLASALVPGKLEWRASLASLPPLVRQLFWIYAGYVVTTIFSLGLVCLLCSQELVSGSLLARAVCIYGAVFWGVRLSLQPWLAVKPYLTTPWLRCGYHALSADFALVTMIYAWSAWAGGN